MAERQERLEQQRHAAPPPDRPTLADCICPAVDGVHVRVSSTVAGCPYHDSLDGGPQIAVIHEPLTTLDQIVAAASQALTPEEAAELEALDLPLDDYTPAAQTDAALIARLAPDTSHRATFDPGMAVGGMIDGAPYLVQFEHEGDEVVIPPTRLLDTYPAGLAHVIDGQRTRSVSAEDLERHNAWAERMAGTVSQARAESGESAMSSPSGDRTDRAYRANDQVADRHWTDNEAHARRVRAVVRHLAPADLDVWIHPTSGGAAITGQLVDVNVPGLVSLILRAGDRVGDTYDKVARAGVPLPDLAPGLEETVRRLVDEYGAAGVRNVITDIADERPHSRACGIIRHQHGPACHPNCPTCHGIDDHV